MREYYGRSWKLIQIVFFFSYDKYHMLYFTKYKWLFASQIIKKQNIILYNIL